MKKKTLCIILNFILLFTATACNNERTVNCEYNCHNATCQISQQESDQSEYSLEVLEEDILDSTESSLSAETLQEDVDTWDLEEEIRLYNEAKDLYLSGKWDGTPITMEGQTVSLSRYDGSILVNDYLVSNYQRSLDLPDPFNDLLTSNLEYILYEGMYAIKDNTLIKYVRGESISLGDPIDWIGLDPQNPEEYDCSIEGSGYYIEDYIIHFPDSKSRDSMYLIDYQPYLYYVEKADTLLLVTTDPISGLKHLYLFPDYNISEIEYLGPILDFCVFGNQSECDFYYLDVDENEWIYSENGPERLSSGLFLGDY